MNDPFTQSSLLTQTRMLPLVVVFGALLSLGSTNKVTGDIALLEARISGQASSSPLEVCVAYNSQHQHYLPYSSGHFYPLINLALYEGCNDQNYNTSEVSLHNAVVAVSRGTCTFIQKAQMVESFQGAMALVVDYKNSTHLTPPGGNESEFRSINITVVTISWDDFSSVIALSDHVEVSVYIPATPLMDANMIVLIILSTGLVMIGAAWAGYDEWKFSKVSRRRSLKARHAQDGQGDDSSHEEHEISLYNIMVWFVLICLIIVLMYFFYDYIVYFFIVVFVISAAYSLYHCLLPIWSRCLPVTIDIPLDRLPCIKSKVKLRSFLLLVLCTTVAVFWAMQRHAKYAWILQDILGATFTIFCIHTLRLPNLKVIGFLLILLVIYDVFFVFITPLFTKDGNSIMESVATGGKGNSKESLPMVFLIPTLSNSQLRKCIDREFSLLGFGDVVIPGFLVAYNAVFDVRTGSKFVYFIGASVGYLVGMIVCMISLTFMSSGQPALLYLVPGTLFTTVAISLIRKEFFRLFLGLYRNKSPRNVDENESQVPESEEGDVNNDCLDEEEKKLIKIPSD